jgi:hypothetical protein
MGLNREGWSLCRVCRFSHSSSQSELVDPHRRPRAAGRLGCVSRLPLQNGDNELDRRLAKTANIPDGRNLRFVLSYRRPFETIRRSLRT